MIGVIDLNNLTRKEVIEAVAEAVAVIREEVDLSFVGEANAILVLIPQSMPHPHTRTDIARVAELCVRGINDAGVLFTNDEHELLVRHRILLTNWGFWWGHNPKVQIKVRDMTPNI